MSPAKAVPASFVALSRCFWGTPERTATGVVNRWICLCPDRPTVCPNRPGAGVPSFHSSLLADDRRPQPIVGQPDANLTPTADAKLASDANFSMTAPREPRRFISKP